MRAGADTHAHGQNNHHGGYRGIMRRITATNRKDVGTLRVEFSLTMFFVGFANIAGEILFSQPRSAL